LRKQTGVWVGEKKIGAVGVRISSGVTTHGLALNVNTDLAYFRCIVPCGLPDKEVVTMQNILGLQLDLREVADEMLDAFQARFGYTKACPLAVPSGD
jgi:lipoate-protein ligase B